MPLFQIAVVENKPGEAGNCIVEPTWRMATSEKAARMKATVDFADILKDANPEFVEVLVRPFG